MTAKTPLVNRSQAGDVGWPRPGAGVTAEELVAHCRRLIAGYKIPRFGIRSEPLPRSAPGKLLKHELRDPFWAGHDRRVN